MWCVVENGVQLQDESLKARRHAFHASDFFPFLLILLYWYGFSSNIQWHLHRSEFTQSMTLIPDSLLPNDERFPEINYNGCGMPTGDTCLWYRPISDLHMLFLLKLILSLNLLFIFSGLCTSNIPLYFVQSYLPTNKEFSNYILMWSELYAL